jgi:hypothetical protein
MSSYVRPFGFLGSRYKVTDRGLLHYRLSWASAIIGIGLGILIVVGTLESPWQGWIGAAVMLIAFFVALRFTALVVENGDPSK